MAHSGKDSLQIIRSEALQAVVLDLMMPEMDGWDVCRQVRTFSNIPILILSCVSDVKSLNEAKQAGANDYLVKPVPSELLVSRLRTIIHQN
ncbi:MAG: response regulator transcription factor [Candidatus Villigracilaceae bacterium]